MGKRKKERTPEEIRRKIQKLENQLADAPPPPPCDEPTLSQEDFQNDYPVDIPDYETPPPWIDNAADNIQHEEQSQSFPSPPSPDTDSSSSMPDPPEILQQSTSELPLPPPLQPGPSSEDKTDELELGNDILELLGDAPKPESPLGPPIHKDIAHRWQDTLTKGLSKDMKESLVKNYLVPSNCVFLQAPALNPEVKAALPDPLVKRDMSLLYKQKQLGVALSALATVTDMVISNETSKQKLLKPLSDACRVLCDSHFTETKTRRNFVISSINAKLKNALIESNRDTLLFGENVSEKLKTAKTIQQTGETLKNGQRPRFPRQNTGNVNNKINLNSTPQHRKTDNKPANRIGGPPASCIDFSRAAAAASDVPATDHRRARH